MQLHDGVLNFLHHAQNNQQKICIITNLTAHIQHRKINTLLISKYIDYLVTSEEVGIEKPAPLIFHAALKKLSMQPSDVCMIGDDLQADALAGKKLGIDSLLFNQTKEIINYAITHKVKIIKSFKELL